VEEPTTATKSVPSYNALTNGLVVATLPVPFATPLFNTINHDGSFERFVNLTSLAVDSVIVAQVAVDIDAEVAVPVA
jgi:hypothetical protein